MPAGESMSAARTITDEELLQLPKDGNKYEVVNGELVVSPGAGFRHEEIVAELVTRLRSFAKERRLGTVLPSNLLYVEQIKLDGVLNGEDVLPGFRCPLSELID